MHPAHLKTFDYSVHRYFLTFCTFERQPIFLGPDRVDFVLTQILRAADEEHVAVFGFLFKKRFGGELWQRYGYEHVLRSDEETLAVARYIFENPIRAGLVKQVEDYPFAGSQRYGVAQILEAALWDPRQRSS